MWYWLFESKKYLIVCYWGQVLDGRVFLSEKWCLQLQEMGTYFFMWNQWDFSLLADHQIFWSVGLHTSSFKVLLKSAWKIWIVLVWSMNIGLTHLFRSKFLPWNIGWLFHALPFWIIGSASKMLSYIRCKKSISSLKKDSQQHRGFDKSKLVRRSFLPPSLFSNIAYDLKSLLRIVLPSTQYPAAG